MRKIKLILIMAAIMLPALTFALDYPWLTFRMTDNTEISVDAENLAITFKDGNLLLSSSTVDQTIPANQIKSMRFTATSAGVDDIADIQSTAGVYYNLSGIKVGKFNSVEEARKELSPGVYIVKGNLKTYKVTI